MRKIIALTIIIAAAAFVFRRGRPELHRASLSVAKKSDVTSVAQKPTVKSIAAIKSVRPEKVSTDSFEIRLQKVTALSHVVFPTESQTKTLRSLLSDPRMAAAIDQSLSDPTAYEGQAFQHKLRLLDTLYTALKFPDSRIRHRYFDVADRLLNESAPSHFSTEWKRQFLADRAEIAMVLLKINPRSVASFQHTREAARAFSQARHLSSLYEVGL